jgi:hypothetical protein
VGWLAEAGAHALRTEWFHKWVIHRRLWPEEFAGHVHHRLSGTADYPISEDLFSSPVLEQVCERYGSFLLPQAFPEGCPTHPSYGGGHAVIAGACVTMLKAFFDEAFVISEPVVAGPDGLALLPWRGEPLTVGGELNKLASNISQGRNIGGVHWRSDGFNSLLAGERVAIAMLEDFAQTYNEPFGGFSLTRFDGTQIRVGA